MMRLSQLGAIVLLASAGAHAQAAPRPRLVIGTEVSVPFVTLEKGQLAGITTDKIRAVMDRVGIDYTIEVLPFKRAYLLAQTRPDVCIYSLTRIPERDALFKWIGPTQKSDWTLFGRAGRNYGIASLDDARKYRIGAYFGDVRGDTLAEQGFTVSTVRERVANPRKLLVDRIDLWASSLQMAGSIVEENGWSGRIVPVLTFRRTELYLGCSMGVPDELVVKMNAALRALDSEGISAAIERRYNWAGSKPR